MSRQPCRKCLLAQLDRDEYDRKLKKYIDAIPGEIRTDEAVYSERLKLCTECDGLVDGMCSECGCYVELRAARKDKACPIKRWTAVRR